MSDRKPVGGRRSYQPGRPPKPAAERHRKVTFSVPPDVAEWLLGLERRSDWLTEVARQVRSDVRSQPALSDEKPPESEDSNSK